MAFITLKTNQSISQEKQATLTAELGNAVACVPYQSANSILIMFEAEQAMWYRDNSPVALIEFRAFGNETHLDYAELTAQINQILHRLLGIAPERIFVKYDDITAWGIGGHYIDRHYTDRRG